MPESTIESEQADGNKGDKAVRIASGLASHHLQPPASPTTETCNNDEDCLSEDSGHGEPNATKPQNEQEESRTKLQQSSPLSSAALGIPTTKRAETPKRFSPTPSPSVSFTSYAEAEIPESMSELSAEEDNPPSSPVRSFFYPSKQSPLQTIETGPIENLNGGWKATDDRGPGRRRVQSNMNGQTKVSPIPKIPLRPSRGTPKLDSSREKETFEDEHDVSDVLSPRHVTSPPSSRDPSTLVSPGSSINDSSNVDYATQERQDKALVEKFWTAYDEILILSIFTQVGILCRLGAAYFFQNFSDVFHSDSALFTNLPLNCLSCFVMGLLCSGESLMQIIGTRFTPPRLQRDLHRETILQCQETTLDDGESPYDQRIVDDDEEMIEMTTIETERKGWRRRRKRRRAKRKTNRNRRRNNRLSNLSQQHRNKHAQNPDIYNELREVQLLAWERRIRASICLLLFPVKKEEVDIVETYFSEGYERERNFYGGEEKTEESGTVLSPKFENQTSGCDAVFSDSGNTDMGGFDDLIFEEEIDHSPRKPPPRKLPHKTPEMKSTGSMGS
ncbi:unnamed protein product [Pseudo-nitzschia multistriata]|uniref:Uncharacterized protein n=1 Tax=Pseudo-nitzschia multistriata TaxID=183589 RepID=A0A448Z6P4_9STRA|nr:unnamed protein product [Pseudo-nitzschia multistriata]